MLPIERHDRIEQALRTTRVLGTEDIARALDVSVETIRRDFMTLEQRGLLTRVHGGAIGGGSALRRAGALVRRSWRCCPTVGRRPSDERRPPWSWTGRPWVMDVGTTVLAVARALSPGFRGTVATCSLLVAAELAEREHVEVLLSGGRVRGGDLALSNSQTLGFFADLRADIAFLGSGGVDAAAGLTDFHVDEVATRRLLIANASASWVLADASKLGLVAPHRVCGLDAIDGVITDADAAPEPGPRVAPGRRPVGLHRRADRTGSAMTAVLAIDQGTSGTKAIVVDHPAGTAGTRGTQGEACILAAVEVPIRPAYLGEGRVEQDPAALLASVLDAGRQAVALAGRPVGTVSLANQGETVLAWDPSSGRPLSSAIVWQDARAQGICDELAFHRTWVAQKTGLVLDPYFSAPKMGLAAPGTHRRGRRHHHRQLAAAPSDRRVRHRCRHRQPFAADEPGCGRLGPRVGGHLRSGGRAAPPHRRLRREGRHHVGLRPRDDGGRPDRRPAGRPARAGMPGSR